MDRDPLQSHFRDRAQSPAHGSAAGAFAAADVMQMGDEASIDWMREGEGAMRRQIALLEIVGFFGLVGAAVAQTLSSAPGASLDGTYRFVSSTRVNHTYV